MVGDSKGPKVDIFKYKNKTGYRRHLGHRQKYTKVQIDEIGASSSRRRKQKVDDKQEVDDGT